jgi:ubiquinone/menaquinone biosynthesis C-methylase UbiE
MNAVQVDHTHYNDLNYNEQGRFNSYWHQIDWAIKLKPESILEIGTGNGFVNFALKRSGFKVTTIDIDPNLQPDVLGSVLSMPIGDESVDLAMCCQVLEHLPYDNFVPALKEIRRVIKKNVILSLPDLERVYRVSMQLPGMREKKFIIPIPRLKPLKWEFNGEHYWNISCENFPLKRIVKDIQSAGFSIEANYCVYEMPWHRFFILKK